MRRKLFIDQDTLGPASTNLQSVALLLNAPDVDVLGIGVATGDHWRDQQVRHALRLLEIMGRTDVPVAPGARMPLVNTPADTAAWEAQHGALVYKGAWDLARPGKWANPIEIRDLPEGNPTTAPASEHAAALLVRLARAHPGELSLWCGAPLTNIAVALQLEPRLPEFVRELHFMGGAFNPPADAREFRHSPRREFNLRFDPEAARAVFRASWRHVTCSPIDVSHRVRSTPEWFARIAAGGTPFGAYLDQFGQRERPLWDEVAAATWVDPTLVTESDERILDVDLDRGAHYGDLLDWAVDAAPPASRCRVRVQRQIDVARFLDVSAEWLGGGKR